MHFSHSPDIWRDFPELTAGVLLVRGITRDAAAGRSTARFSAIAASRLSAATEAELPEVQAWRRTFARMGLKPTQYRCAAESLLRRFRKEGALPQIHPAIDLCNSISLAFAIPIAVFDVARIAEYLEVRYATGSEVYLAFSGETEHPAPREVVFADGEGRAHARRWTHRQSAASAVRDDTTTALVVAEAMHPSALEDVQKVIAAVGESFEEIWSSGATSVLLSRRSPRFEW